MSNKRVVFVEGTRTPFQKSGTGYFNLMSYELGKFAIRGLLDRTNIDPQLIDRVVMGTTISNVKTGNVARESAITAGVPHTAPCHTVTMACISANQAITSGYNMIMTGEADIVIAGGTDSISDAPIQFPKKMRKKLYKAQKLKTLGEKLGFFFSLRPSDFIPEAPAVAEYITGRTMGYDCELLASRIGVSREEQDEFAARSHQFAAQHKDKLANEITPVELKPKFKKIEDDNGVRGDSTKEKMAKLKPAFSKPHGTITAANASFLTDGATATLIMSEEKALELGFKPKTILHSYAYSGQDLYEELLLGPTYATSKVMEKSGLTLDDMDVIEFHEAFAGQILANIKCLASDEFAQEHLGREKAVGKVDMSKFNLWGGSLSLGHPFGATGGRLLTTASNRLIEEGGKYALLAACAAGAHGHAMILERYQD